MTRQVITGRLDADFLQRCADFGSRALRLVEKLEKDRRPRRVVDQIAGATVGSPAHFFEASEALSRRDFIKTLGIAAKELSESQYWLTLVETAGWLASRQLDELLNENRELLIDHQIDDRSLKDQQADALIFYFSAFLRFCFQPPQMQPANLGTAFRQSA